MRTSLSAVQVRALRLIIACFLLALTIAASTKAQAPPPAGFTEGICTVESSTVKGEIQWTIKGSATVSSLPGSSTVTLNFKFKKKANGAAGFVTFNEVDQTTSSGAGGTKTYSTNPIGLTTPPMPGDQYMFVVTGTYKAGPPPGTTISLGTKDSNVATPVP
ncbi:MAG: hypothetical protein U0797_08780 [Gemmataceae bacterium]